MRYRMYEAVFPASLCPFCAASMAIGEEPELGETVEVIFDDQEDQRFVPLFCALIVNPWCLIWDIMSPSS